jgi:hypothetical protein
MYPTARTKTTPKGIHDIVSVYRLLSDHHRTLADMPHSGTFNIAIWFFYKIVRCLYPPNRQAFATSTSTE